MSRHLPDCAGDDYCTGQCRYDGIPQPAILERASDISCRCDPMRLHHAINCPDTPLFKSVAFDTKCWPFQVMYLHRIDNTWVCAKHGQCGDINGPVHYELCPINGSLIHDD